MTARFVLAFGLVLLVTACEKKSTTDNVEPRKAEPAAAAPNMIGAVQVKKPTTVVSPGTGAGTQPGEKSGSTKKPGGGGNDISPVQH